MSDRVRYDIGLLSRCISERCCERRYAIDVTCSRVHLFSCANVHRLYSHLALEQRIVRSNRWRDCMCICACGRVAQEKIKTQHN